MPANVPAKKVQMTSPDQPQQPPREPYAVRHERHMAERRAADDARRAARGLEPKRPASHAGTCLIFGALLVLAALLGPRLPIWWQTPSGQGVSLTAVHGLCSSGLGELAQAGDGAVRSRCSEADVLSGLAVAVLIGGALLAAAGVALWARLRPTAG